MVFVVAQLIFYAFVMSQGPDKKLKEKLEEVLTRTNFEACNKIPTNANERRGASHRETNTRNALKKTVTSLIVAIAIAFATMNHMDSVRVLLISNLFVILSYVTEIFLYFYIFEPYPIITDVEILSILLSSAENDAAREISKQ